MAISKKLIFSGLTAAAVLALTACGSNQNQTVPSSQSVASSKPAESSSVASTSSAANSSSSASASSSEQAANGELDGSYQTSHEGDQLTLQISGTTGQLTKVEADGEQEIEQVHIDATNQTMIIGDDVKRYRIEGNQLTIEDLSQEPYDDDTLVFTKQ
ncbi:SP_0198 family lipoprotein [Streptococcus sanguinis]|uniref:SP_0198 family lipoprotein n=1 Tax=Streptococcus sanguinis TaxID=1305 RepID=UPI001CC14EA7|nr:SP_0198 family lipoprotein [Streptococcus sanguinis]MBZ2020188.1 lipocalin/fatty acid-binding family protein [Streptococcus sanguinis]MCC3165981.1 bacterial lipofamily protein [Streptococcus sanguinis]